MNAAAGYARIIAAALLWGTIGIAGRAAFHHGVLPLEAAFFRALIAVVFVAAYVLATDRQQLRVRRSDLLLFASFGLVSVAVFFFVYLYAISRTSIATAAILLYTAPVFVILLSAVLFKEPLTRAKIAAAFLAFAGCVLVVRGYDPQSLRPSLPGILAGLASGLTYAMYTIFGKTALRRYSPVTTLFYSLGFGAIFLGIAAIPPGVARLSHPPAAWGVIAYLGLVITLVSAWLYLGGLQHVEAGRASLVATIEPVVAAILGYLLLGERLENWQILGGVLVLTAVLLVQRSRTSEAQPSTASSPP